MELVRKGTPIDRYLIQGKDVWVKREDLCVDEAEFSKLRGVAAHLFTIKQPIIGVLDSFHSKAGWGSTYLGTNMGKHVVVFHPVYKNQKELREPQQNAERLGAELIGIQAGRSCILYHRAKKILKEKYPDSYMLPNALKLMESVQETSEEVDTVPRELLKDTLWVISVSSGTIGAGVLLGLIKHNVRANVIIHMGYSRSKDGIRKYMLKKIGKEDFEKLEVTFIDEGYGYKDFAVYDCPFPCNQYYDLKAWKWLMGHLDKIEERSIMFWNIGS